MKTTQLNTIKEMYKAAILYRLEYFGDNKVQTAQSLGITTKTLYNKLHEFNIEFKLNKKGGRPCSDRSKSQRKQEYVKPKNRLKEKRPKLVKLPTGNLP